MRILEINWVFKNNQHGGGHDTLIRERNLTVKVGGGEQELITISRANRKQFAYDVINL